MQQHIISAFPSGMNVKPCMTPFSSKVVYIDDSKILGKCIWIEKIEDETKYLKITNPTKKIIVLFAIDGCFYGRSQPPKHCDCIIFDDNTFCFAELKLDYKSRNPHENTIKKTRNKAINQLLSTFKIFRDAFSNNFLGFSLEAYICTPTHYPAISTKFQNFSLKTSRNLGLTLIESNKKTFT